MCSRNNNENAYTLDRSKTAEVNYEANTLSCTFANAEDKEIANALACARAYV